MHKSMLSILLILSLALFTFLICPAFQVDAITSRDLINFGAATLTIIGLGVAFGFVYMAMAVYQKSVKDSSEHKKRLEVSGSQLRALVDAEATRDYQHGDLEGSGSTRSMEANKRRFVSAIYVE